MLDLTPAPMQNLPTATHLLLAALPSHVLALPPSKQAQFLPPAALPVGLAYVIMKCRGSVQGPSSAGIVQTQGYHADELTNLSNQVTCEGKGERVYIQRNKISSKAQDHLKKFLKIATSQLCWAGHLQRKSFPRVEYTE